MQQSHLEDIIDIFPVHFSISEEDMKLTWPTSLSTGDERKGIEVECTRLDGSIANYGQDVRG